MTKLLISFLPPAKKAIVCKPFTVSIKFCNRNPIYLPCSPFDTIEEFLKMRKISFDDCIVTLDSEGFFSRRSSRVHKLNTTKANPIKIRDSFSLPITREGKIEHYKVEVTEHMGDFIKLTTSSRAKS